jgi:hypothetical protein
MPRSSSPIIIFLRRIAITIAIVVTVVVGCAIAAGFIPFSNDGLKHQIETAVERSFADSCSIGSLTITLWKGVTAGRIQCAWSSPAAAFSCTVPSLSIRYHILPLIFRQCVIKNIELAKPQIRCEIADIPPGVRLPPSKPFSFDDLSRALSSLPVSIIIRNISLSRGHAIVVQKKKTLFDCAGVNSSLHVGLNRSIELAGKCFIDGIDCFEAVHCSRMTSAFQINGNILSLTKSRAECYGGTISAQGTLDLSSLTLRDGRVNIEHLSLEQWYKASGSGPGRITGMANALLDVGRCRLAVDALTAHGNAVITDVAAHDLPIQKNLITILGNNRLLNLRFSKITANINVNEGKVHTDDIDGRGDLLDFTGGGWVDFDGHIFEDATGVFSREFLGMLPGILRNSLLPDENGEPRVFRAKVSGTFERPCVTIDRQLVNRAVGNVVKEIHKGLGKLFGK